MKKHLLFPIVAMSFFIAGCGSQNAKTVSQLSSDRASLQEVPTESTQDDFPADVKAAKDSKNQSVLKESSSFYSCISDTLVHVGSPSVKKTTCASINIGSDDSGNVLWNVTMYVSTSYFDYSFRIEYFPESDKSECVQISNWGNDHVYWVDDASSFSGDLYNYETDLPLSGNSGETEETETVPSSIDGVVIDYRGGFDNDATGNWRLSCVITDKSIKEYAFDYYKSFFKNDSEIHWIINYSDGTTSRINCIDGYLFVSVYSHVDGEENSAKEIGAGNAICDYVFSAKDGSLVD